MARGKQRVAKTLPFIMSYPHLITPQERPVKPGEAPKPPDYNCVAIFAPGADLTPLKTLAAEARDSFFKGQKPRGLRSPFRKCEEMWKEDDNGKLIPEPGYVAGGTFISLKAGKEKPDCRDQYMKPITDAGVLYAGCKCVAVVTAYGYDREGNKGVSFGLKALQKIGEGENIAGRVSADDYFEPVKELEDNATTGATTGDGWDEDDESY